MLRRLNDLPIFDPARLPGRELVARLAGCLAAGAFLLRMILSMPAWPGVIREVYWALPWFSKLSFLPGTLVAAPFDLDRAYSPFYTHEQIRTLWVLQFLFWAAETALFPGYIVALLTRARARSVAKGFMQTAFPLMLTCFPFITALTEHTFQHWFRGRPDALLKGLLAVYSVLLLAGTVNLVGLVCLRRAFTIMSEARVFVRSGIYRYVRHPLYAAHFVIYLCQTIIHFHAATLGLYLVFVAGQTLRARIEERKLAEEFPEYADYRRRVGMFFPIPAAAGSTMADQPAAPS